MRSFFQSVRIERFHPVAKARQAKSEVRILSDVPLVPGAHPDKGLNPEVVRGAPEWNWQIERAQARIDNVE